MFSLFYTFNVQGIVDRGSFDSAVEANDPQGIAIIQISQLYLVGADVMSIIATDHLSGTVSLSLLV